MNYSLPRTLIEIMVRKTISDIQTAPKRSTRNLVDMALNFADGRFQNRFLQMAQTMLKNDSSAYYKLIPDIATTVDPDKIVMFGLNLGYNSCTAGAKKIRMLEKREHFNIPWSISLAISGKDYSKRKNSYLSIVEQGKALGVYTWMIYGLDGIKQLLELAVLYPDCAFVLYCIPGEITDVLLDAAEHITNLMFAVRHTEGVEDACHLLRSRHFLYSVFHTYNDTKLEAVLNGTLLNDTETLHPTFTAFLAEQDCSKQARQSVYQYVAQTRAGQKCPTVLWDTFSDSCFIDSVISEDSCLAVFDADGYLCTVKEHLCRLNCNMFRQPLSEILRISFPKTSAVPALS